MTLRTTARRSLLALALCFALLPPAGCKSVKGLLARLQRKSPNSAGAAGPVDDYGVAVAQLVAAPKLETLRWPDDSDVRAPLTAFYTGRGDALAWTDDGKPTAQAAALLKLFGDAQLKGLEPEDYDASRWAARLQRLEAIRTSKDDSDGARLELARFDVAVTVAALRYLEDLHTGRVNPESLNFDIDVPAKRAGFDVAGVLSTLATADAAGLADAVARLEPQNPMYRGDEAALPQYIALAQAEDANPPTPLPALAKGVKPVDVGGTYPALGQLLARLQRKAYAPPSAAEAVGPATYTADMAAMVKLFQQQHGLQDDGKLGQATLDALNVPMRRRVQQIDDALERWRWLPETYIQPRVLVNLPEFLLRAYTPGHALDFKMRVVDGESDGHDTPMFVREMRYVVFRPYWNLPASIVKKEIVPHVEKSPDYLAAHGYEATRSDGTVVSGVSAADLRHSRVLVRQRPGASNSLGLVKFLFPNEYDIYMHSTPELNLFALSRRDRSHGCVRLQHADQMALWVLSGDQPDPARQTAWDADKIHDAMTNEAKNNRTIGLKTPLPVVITYLTANADEDGSMHFFNDMYGYDKALEAALAKGRPYEQTPVKINPTLIPGETE